MLITILHNLYHLISPFINILLGRSEWDWKSVLDHTTSTVLNFCFSVYGILLCEPKMSATATFGQPWGYLPVSRKRWFSVSAELSQDQPDQPGWKWRACGHLLRGWEGEISLLITGGYWSLDLLPRITNRCFSSFIIHPEITVHIKPILSILKVMLMMWNLGGVWYPSSYFHERIFRRHFFSCQSINLEFYLLPICTHKSTFFSLGGNL